MAKKKLSKLKIWAYKDDTYSALTKGLRQPLTVSINPDSYKRSFKPVKVSGGTKMAVGEIRDVTIVDPPPERFSMELWFDGTGAIPGTTDVATAINEFKKFALLYNGSIHSVNFVKLEWGGQDGLVFKGQLESFSVDYSYFNQAGKPLRAKGQATFVESIDPALSESMRQKTSPDLTHIRVVGAGDTLPLMCYHIYGNAAYYVQVARANALEDLMTLEPGQRLYFPPLK